MRTLLTRPRLELWVTDRSDGNLSCAWEEDDQPVHRTQHVLAEIGCRPEHAVLMQVTHEDTIYEASLDDRGRGILDRSSAPVAEALLTREVGTMLCLLTADCVPLIVCDRSHELLLLAHVGRAPLFRGLVSACVECLKVHGADDISAYLGPGIGPDSYRLDHMPQGVPEDLSSFVLTGDDGIRIDLPGAITYQLTHHGVPADRVCNHGSDTYTDEDQFSHLRSMHTGEPEGRFMTLVRMV